MSFALYFDENVDSLLAEMLAQAGHDVLTTQAARQRGASDEEQVSFAAASGRAIFTHDRRDYRRIAMERAIAGQTHGGTILSERAPPPVLRRWVLELFDLFPDGIEGLFLHLPFRR